MGGALHWGVLGLLFLAAACGAPAETPGPADRPPVVVEAKVDRAQATTGDVIRYTLHLDRDPEIEASLPEVGADIGGFRIVDSGRRPPERTGARVVEERWYDLRADLAGSYVLPAVAVTYRDAAGDERRAETSQIFVEITSVLPEDGSARDIRPPKPPLPLTRRPGWLPWAAGAAALLLLAGLGAGLWWRSRRSPAAAPALPPHVVALDALDRLRQVDFDDPSARRAFFFQLSALLRRYLEDRFGFNATDLTSEQLWRRVREAALLPAADLGAFRSFLDRSDTIKYAGAAPRIEDVEESYEFVLSLVEKTSPREEEEEQEEVAA